MSENSNPISNENRYIAIRGAMIKTFETSVDNPSISTQAFLAERQDDIIRHYMSIPSEWRADALDGVRIPIALQNRIEMEEANIRARAIDAQTPVVDLQIKRPRI